MYSQILTLGCLFGLILCLEGSPPCSVYGCPQPAPQYHYPRPQSYVPAPPGKTPPCAKHGRTYCVDVEHYPQQLITHLVSSWQYDYNTLLTNEQVEAPRPVYGPPPNVMQAFPFVGKTYFDPTLPGHQYINFTAYYSKKGGYPERRYPLGGSNLQSVSSDPGFIYSAIIRPELVPPQVTNYDPGSWWKRYSRSHRTKRQTQQTTLCPTRTEFIMPKAAVNNQGHWKYVVNLDQDKRYTQLVGSETCLQSQCDGICSLPNGYSSKCEQQFVQKRLIALDGTGNSLYTDIFWLPHCCVCQITPNGN